MALVMPLQASSCDKVMTLPLMSLPPYIGKPSAATPIKCDGPPAVSTTDVMQVGTPW